MNAQVQMSGVFFYPPTRLEHGQETSSVSDLYVLPCGEYIQKYSQNGPLQSSVAVCSGGGGGGGGGHVFSSWYPNPIVWGEGSRVRVARAPRPILLVGGMDS